MIEADQPGAAKIVKGVFKDGKGDKVTASLKGGKSLRLRFAMQTNLLKLIAQLQADQGADQ